MSRGAWRFLGWWVAAWTVFGVVILSLGPDVNPSSSILDYLGHAVAYAVLMIVLLLALYRRRRPPWPSLIALSGALVAFGAAMELAQAAVHRDATVGDGFADALGVGLTLGAYSLLRLVRMTQWPEAVTRPDDMTDA
jgi:VanZ family protein